MWPIQARLAVIVCVFAVACDAACAAELPPIPPIARALPPLGIPIPPAVRAELEEELRTLEPLTDVGDLAPDLQVFTKAVRYALRFHEFYDAKDFDKARWALKQVEARLQALAAGTNKALWTMKPGLVVHGYRSPVDDSIQPFGLVIPQDHDFSRAAPAIVWLHGRGDKQTDLHFLYERAHKVGDFAPPGVVVIHAFGRQCLGYKSAGERDVLDVVDAANRRLSIDRKRVVLAGFSMGGAGAWHLGAHYAEQWAGVFPGAGFADTAQYQKLKPENYPPAYEQALWGAYDVPPYVRNLFNVPVVVAYSGENDKQIQAAQLMEDAFRAEGRTLEHWIGPGVGHQYQPMTKAELQKRIDAALAQERDFHPRKLHLQTRTLRYHTQYYATIRELRQHWQDARLDVDLADKRSVTAATRNIAWFTLDLDHFKLPPGTEALVDGQRVPLRAPFPERHVDEAHFALREGKWQCVEPDETAARFVRGPVRKSLECQGPIDDAFLDPFLVVVPSGTSPHPRVQQWVEFELAHLRERWAATFRGEVRIKRDVDVTREDLLKYHLVAFGDAESNAVVRQALARLPLTWTQDKVELAGKSYAADTHVPLLIYPNPLATEPNWKHRYLVLNSGPTFREAHDRTNSQQNPKLPDWAVIDITTPPNAQAPGKVVAADFFDEAWQVKR